MFLSTQLSALMGMTSQSTPWKVTEIGVIANLLFEMNPGLTTMVEKKCFLFIKATVSHALGILVIKEGIPESARNALAHFRQYLEANEGIGYVKGIN